MAAVDRCIAHTPTALDMYCKQAQFLKKAGAAQAAANAMDRCRALDLQVR